MTNSHTIAGIDAIEILDSRGNPTLQVRVRLASGIQVEAGVPAGASTSRHEARELRDGDSHRFGGLGVQKAAANIEHTIAPALIGRDPIRQAEIDRLLRELDGTADKSALGANAIVGVSMAVARAAAHALRVPLYRYLGGVSATRLPVPLMNVINGGKHAGDRIEFQEFMIVPHGAPSFAEALRWGAETFYALKHELHDRALNVSVGDEGGFAPELRRNEEACELIVRAIEQAGFRAGRDISIALDPAATSFWHEDHYRIAQFGAGKTTDGDLEALYEHWLKRFPIVMIEDGFHETAWSAFQRQTERIGQRAMIVGDDLYSTNPHLIRRGIAEHTTNAVLIKLNQIGTVTETIEAIELCRTAGWGYVISHRSGETSDAFIADFAVAMGGGLIKAGSLCRGERLAKYNRLVEIERELGRDARFIDPFAGSAQYRA